MAAVYKALSKSAGDSKADAAPTANGAAAKRNKQRVLILSSRGVTYRYAMPAALIMFQCIGYRC